MADCVVAQLTTCRGTLIVTRTVPRMAAVRPGLWVHREEPVDHVPNDLRLAPSAQRDGDDRTGVGYPAKASRDTEELRRTAVLRGEQCMGSCPRAEGQCE